MGRGWLGKMGGLIVRALRWLIYLEACFEILMCGKTQRKTSNTKHHRLTMISFQTQFLTCEKGTAKISQRLPESYTVVVSYGS